MQKGMAQDGEGSAAAGQGNPTARPDPKLVAALEGGPELPYVVDPNWPRLPKGYNFGECSGVDIDKAGNVWVFNRGHWPVMQFDRAGNLLQAWSTDTCHFVSPHGIRVGPDGNLWLVDVNGHLVFKYSTDGRILMILGNRQGTPGNNESQDGFNRPTNVAFRSNGNIYISDGYVNSRVVEYTADGLYVGQWGKPGLDANGAFHLVHDVVVGEDGRVYVADRSNERVQVFDADGKFITKWTGIGAPWGLCYVAAEKAIYMCDGKYARIIKLSLDGKVLGTLGSYGRTQGKLDFVHSITVDPSDGSIYTVEIKNWRVQKWIRQSR